jgi:Protease inhibitor Inh
MTRAAIIFAAVAWSLCGSVAVAQGTQPQSDQPQSAQPSSEPPPSDQPQITEPPSEQQPSAPRDPVAAMIGAWEFSNADHDKICRFNFRSDAATGGHKLDIDKSCPSLFPSTKEVIGWAVDNYGSLHLLDGSGNAVIELTEVESGMYDGFQPDEGRYILQAAAAAPVRSADEMVGDWAVARGTGKPICVLTLANSAAGADALALKIKSGCDVLITRFGPTSWHMDNGELVLLSPRGQTWRFEENDANTWQRVPESSDPILLVRQ